MSYIHAPELTNLEISHSGPCVNDVGELLPESFTFHGRSRESNVVKVVASEGRMSIRNGIHVSLAIVPEFDEGAPMISQYLQCKTFECQLSYHTSGAPRSTPALTMGILRRICSSPENMQTLLVRSLERFRHSLPFNELLGYFHSIECLEVVYDSDNLNGQCLQLFDFFGAVARAEADEMALMSVTKLVLDVPPPPRGALQNLLAFLERRAARGRRLSFLGFSNLREIEKDLAIHSKLTTVVERLAIVPWLSNKYDRLESDGQN